MGQPILRSSRLTTITSNSTSWTLTFPQAGDIVDGGANPVESGDLIVVQIGRDGSSGTGTITGYTNKFDQAVGTAARGLTFAKTTAATGSEGDLTYAPGASEQGVGRISVFKNCFSGAHTDVQCSSVTTGTDASCEVTASFSPSWGSADVCWIAASAHDSGLRDYTAGPTSVFPDNYNHDTSGGGTGAGYGSAMLFQSAVSTSPSSPGAFTLDSADDWLTWVVAIRGNNIVTRTKTVAATAVIQRTGITKQVTATVVVQRTGLPKQVTFTANISTTRTKAVAGTAVIQKTVTDRTIAATGVLQQTVQKTVNMAAVALLTRTAAVACSAEIAAAAVTRTKPLGLAAVIQRPGIPLAVGATAVILRQGITRTVAATGVIQRQGIAKTVGLTAVVTAGFRAASGSFTTGTSTGDLAAVTANLDGATPQLIMMMVGRGGRGGGVETYPNWAFGAWCDDGSGTQTNCSASALIFSLANTTTDIARRLTTGQVMANASSTSALDGSITLNLGALAANSFTPNVPAGGGGAWGFDTPISWMAWSGLTNCKVGTFTATGAGAQTMSAIGFKPDLLIFFGEAQVVNTFEADGSPLMGWSDGTTNRVVVNGWQDALADTNTWTMLSNTSCWANINGANGAVVHAFNVTGMTSTGFTYNRTNGSAARIIPYIAVKFGNTPFQLADLTLPTASGVTSYTGYPFKPVSMLSMWRPTTVFESTGAANVEFGLGWSAGGGSTQGTWFGDEDNQATADPYGYQGTAFWRDNTITTGAQEATVLLSSFDADGYSVNATLAASSAWLAPTILVGETTGTRLRRTTFSAVLQATVTKTAGLTAVIQRQALPVQLSLSAVLQQQSLTRQVTGAAVIQRQSILASATTTAVLQRTVATPLALAGVIQAQGLLKTLGSAAVLTKGIYADTTSSGQGSSGGSSISWSHSMGGLTDGVLVVVLGWYGRTSDGRYASSVTWNGTALTNYLQYDNGTAFPHTEVWYLLAPEAGTHTIAVTLNTALAGDVPFGAAGSYGGVNQTTPLEASHAKSVVTGTHGTHSDALTPATDGAWLLAGILDTGTANTATGALTEHEEQAAGAVVFSFADTGPVSPPASTTSSWSFTSTGNASNQVVVALAPAGGTAALTKLVGVSGVVQAQGVTTAVTLAGVVQRQAISSTVASTAVIQRQGLLKSTSFSAELSSGAATLTKTVATDAVVQRQAIVRTATATAVVQRQAIARTVATTGVVQRQAIPASVAATTVVQRQAIALSVGTQGVVQATLPVSLGVSAMLSAQVLRTAAITAVVQGTALRQVATAGVVLRPGVLTTTSIHASVQGTVQTGTALSAVLVNLQTQTTTLTAVLLRQGVLRFVGLTTVIQATPTQAVSLSAVVFGQGLRTVATSTVIRGTVLRQVGTAAVLLRTGIVQQTTTAGVLRATVLATVSLSGAAASINARATALSAVLQKQVLTTSTLSAHIILVSTRTVSLTGNLQATLTRTTTGSAVLQRTTTLVLAVAGVVLRAGLVRTVAFSAVVQQPHSRATTTSAVLRATLVRTSTLTGVVQRTVTRTVALQSVVRQTVLRQVAGSAVLQQHRSAAVGCSAILQAGALRTSSLSAVLQRSSTVSLGTSAMLSVRGLRQVACSASLFGASVRAVALSAYLQGSDALEVTILPGTFLTNTLEVSLVSLESRLTVDASVLAATLEVESPTLR